MNPLNPWLPGMLRKAKRLYEDSDRVTHAAQLFDETIKRVHALATSTAIPTIDPFLERLQLDDGTVVLSLEWLDKSSGWYLYFSVRRPLGEKPHVSLEFSGNPERYFSEKPSDADIRKALHDYFEGWKKK